MLFDHSFSIVSVCSVRGSGINCGQISPQKSCDFRGPHTKLLLTNGNRRGRGVFCCTYVNSESKACQELSRKNRINDWYAVNKEEMFFHRNLYVDSKQNTVAILQSVEIRKILESAY